MTSSSHRPARVIDGNGYLFVPGRPATINGERSKHWRAHRARSATTRAEAALLAGPLRAAGYTFPTMAVVRSWPTYTTRASWPDVGAWMPTVKAVIDGLVDAGAWPDDTAEHVGRLIFDPPWIGDETGLHLEISPYTPTPKEIAA